MVILETKTLGKLKVLKKEHYTTKIHNSKASSKMTQMNKLKRYLSQYQVLTTQKYQ